MVSQPTGVAAPLHDPLPSLLAQTLPHLYSAFSNALPAASEPEISPACLTVLQRVAQRMGDNYPYFHPLYAGQMLKPPHPVARAAYALAMALNPNNHALDGGRASSAMEVEAVRSLAAIFGWDEYVGHLTSGGTFANLEALWICGQIADSPTPHASASPSAHAPSVDAVQSCAAKRIVASEQAHYTHQRISSVLRLPFTSIATDNRGRMDIAALSAELEKGDVGAVVVTLGATATGAVDPLDDIVALRSRHAFRIHADAAYGGYFTLAGNLAPEARRAFDALAHVDSIVVDPHKHGLQPYGCGCILFRDPAVGRFYKHDSPYTYFSSSELHLGEISLECSRAGAAAVALWATQQLLPLARHGDFARGLESCRRAALSLHAQLADDARFVTAFPPELDIVIWAVRGSSPGHSSELAQQIFARAAENQLHLALARLPARFFPPQTWASDAGGRETNPQEDSVLCLRSVLMKPEHETWLPEIYGRLSRATDEVLRR